MTTLVEAAEAVRKLEQQQAKERPILFNGAMVRAILSGQKTQTRRIVKGMALEWLQPGMFTPEFVASPDNSMCPFGQPGDRLWVRETWQGPIMDGDEFENEYRDNPDKYQRPEYCFYAADDGSPPEFVDADDNFRCCWRPSIHMPRWACRLVLEIVSVRVERLNDISDDDARAEGTDASHCFFDDGACKVAYPYRTAFGGLWASVYGKESWLSNPWVWVVEFRKVAA